MITPWQDPVTHLQWPFAEFSFQSQPKGGKKIHLYLFVEDKTALEKRGSWATLFRGPTLKVGWARWQQTLALSYDTRSKAVREEKNLSGLPLAFHKYQYIKVHRTSLDGLIGPWLPTSLFSDSVAPLVSERAGMPPDRQLPIKGHFSSIMDCVCVLHQWKM